jgi:transposase
MELLQMPQTVTTELYYAGIDLALRADHLAGVLDERGCPVGKQIRFGRTHDEMERMFRYIVSQVPDGFELVWGCEATGAAWRPVTAYLLNKGQQVSLENPAAVAALRDVNSRFFKDDEVDARTIAELLHLRISRGKELRAVPSPELAAMRSLARRIEGMCNQLGSAKTRLLSYLCDTLLPSLKPSDHEWTGPTMLAVLREFADPRDIARKSLKVFVRSAKRIGGPRTSEVALAKLHQAAVQSVRCYEKGVDYGTYIWELQDAIAEVSHLQDRIQAGRQRLQEQLNQARTEGNVAHGLTVPGVGRATLDILMAFYGPAQQWSTFRAMKRFAGTVPVVERSGNSDCAPRMSKLGEPVIRKIIFQIGQVARRFDAYFAAKYYDQMVHKGKGHAAACISTGLRVLNCLRAVLQQDRPYEYRDPQTGEVITKEQSRELAQTLYVVPQEIRAARAKSKGNTHDNPEQSGQPTKPSQTPDERARHATKKKPSARPAPRTQPQTLDSPRPHAKKTAQADHTQVKDMPKHSHKRAVDLR